MLNSRHADEAIYLPSCSVLGQDLRTIIRNVLEASKWSEKRGHQQKEIAGNKTLYADLFAPRPHRVAYRKNMMKSSIIHATIA